MAKFTIPVNIPERDILDVILCGLESTQWCGVHNYDYRNVEKWFAQPAECLEVYDHYDEDKTYQLSKTKIQLSLQLMAQKYPRHFYDIMSGAFDAITGDVLLQLALLEEIRYA